jgi:hypothetical protein
MLRNVLVCALLLALPAGPAAAQTVEDILARNLQAHGGIEKLKSAQTLKVTARLSSQGLEIPITAYSKRPNMTRKELAMGGETMVFAFDGATAWQLNPLEGSHDPVAIAGPDLDRIRRESEFDSPLVDSSARGYTIALAGTETAGGRTLQHLTVTKNGVTEDCYIDVSTGLEARLVSPAPGGILEQQFSDYRDVQGLRLPFSIRTLQNGVPVADVKIDAIVINAPIDDALFKKP